MIMPMCTALAIIAAPTTNVSPAKIRGICSAQQLSTAHAVHARSPGTHHSPAAPWGPVSRPAYWYATLSSEILVRSLCKLRCVCRASAN